MHAKEPLLCFFTVLFQHPWYFVCLEILRWQVNKICRMSETPFYPREKLAAKQKYFQSVHKYTHLKGPVDKITSVAIPLALATTATFMIVSFYHIKSSESFLCFSKSAVNLFLHDVSGQGDLQYVSWHWQEAVKWWLLRDHSEEIQAQKRFFELFTLNFLMFWS